MPDYVRGRGTLPYMAPEVVNDPQHVSEKADVWSLGMVLWELLTLEIPFAALSPQHIIHGLMLGNLQPPVRTHGCVIILQCERACGAWLPCEELLFIRCPDLVRRLLEC